MNEWESDELPQDFIQSKKHKKKKKKLDEHGDNDCDKTPDMITDPWQTNHFKKFDWCQKFCEIQKRIHD